MRFFLILILTMGSAFAATDETKEPYLIQIEPAYALKDFTLQDLELDPFTKKNLEGKWSWMFMGYTHCPDICPTTLTTMAQAYKKLAEIPNIQNETQVIFLSIDPARDHPPLIKKFLAYFHPDFKAASGPIQALLDLGAELNMTFYYGKQDDQGTYEVAHSASIALIDPQGNFVGQIKHPNNAQAIVAIYMHARKLQE